MRRSSQSLHLRAGVLALFGCAGVLGIGAPAVGVPLLASPPTIESEHASGLTASAATVAAGVNPHGEAVTGCRFQYGTTAKYGFSTGCSNRGTGTAPREVSVELKALKSATTYHFRILASNRAGTTAGKDETFETGPAQLPGVATGEAHEPTERGVTVTASVNPNGEEVTSCRFEYGIAATKYAASARCTKLPGWGTAAVEVTATLKGLAPNTIYHFRISATNRTGTSKGADETFLTAPSEAPIIEAQEAVEVERQTATLTALLNPNGGEVSSCRFEYGTTKGYGLSTPCTELPGSGTTGVEVSAALTGLTPGKLYHFRLSATNPAGPTTSGDATFETEP